MSAVRRGPWVSGDRQPTSDELLERLSGQLEAIRERMDADAPPAPRPAPPQKPASLQRIAGLLLVPLILFLAGWLWSMERRMTIQENDATGAVILQRLNDIERRLLRMEDR